MRYNRNINISRYGEYVMDYYKINN
jgi:hypothetical protein